MTGGDLVPIVAQELSETSKPLRTAIGLALSDTWQAVIGDRVQAWRLERAAELSVKLEAKIKDRGLSPNFDNIPKRFAYTWFDKASQEDEPEIQDLFAELMANAISGKQDATDRRNIDLVSRLSPEDARLFNYLVEKFYDEPKWGANTFILDLDSLFLTMKREGFLIQERAIDGLISIGVIRLFPEIIIDQGKYEASAGRRLTGPAIGNLQSALSVRTKVYLTDLGRLLSKSLGLVEPSNPRNQ